MKSLTFAAFIVAINLPVMVVKAETHQISIHIDDDQPGAVINKDIYGQFAEHLGRGIYEGIWVGKNSDIPNTRGFRNDVIDALREIKVPLIRWPGGCFADEYHWRDGVGPLKSRPVKVNTHWGGVEETNEFGTHEFFELAELLDADAYVNGNLGSGSVQEMAEWLEYMTSDTTSSLANLRRQHGREEPWEIAYFGIGNETWGCGGQMRVEYYADLYTHYATFMKAPKGKRPKMVASGYHGDHTEWTDHLSQVVPKKQLDGISHHYYTMPTGEWEVKGSATEFDERDWFATLQQTLRIDGIIAANVDVLNKNDPEGRYGFFIDEWGTWYDPEPGREPGFLYQQNTLRDALVAAVNFNIFHAYADRVRMTNIAQMVNVLQAMILTDQKAMVLTPTYHVFGMYQVFQNATSLPMTVSANQYQMDEQSIPAVTASAALGEDGEIYLALANLDPNNSASIDVDLQEYQASKATGSLLTASEITDKNTFDAPHQIEPISFSSPLSDLTLPPKSVTVLRLHN